jgi:hypothetical protein
MRHERIHAVKSWYGGSARYDCVFIGKSEEPGFPGLHAARVFLFFSFKHDKVMYPCALIHCDNLSLVQRTPVMITSHLF